MKKHLLKTLLASVMALIATGAWADEISATLVHTASSGVPSATAGAYVSTIDAAQEYINNSAFGNKNWQGAAYAEFSFVIPEGHSIKSATMVWNGVGSGKDRATDVMYVNSGLALDYSAEGLGSGTAEVNLGATLIETVWFPKNATTEFTTDVTDAVKAVASTQSYIIFKFTNNVGSGNLVGKGAESGAPTLTITTISAESMTTYTVKFTDGTNEIKDAATYDVEIGEEYTASEADMAPIYANDKKYIYASGNTTATAVAEAESNVITLVFREAEVFNYSVVSNLGNIIAEGSTFEGEAASVPFGKYIVKDGKLYTKDPINKDYHYTFTPTENNQTETLEYKFVPGVLPVFFSEAEAIEGLTATSSANANIRCSMAEGAYNAGEEPVLVTTLPAGTYKIEGQVWGNSGQTLTISCGETTLELATAGYIVTLSTDEFTLSEETAVYANGGVDGKCFDYILITSSIFYTVAGTEDLTGFTWDPTQNKMTLNNGLYEKTFENITVTAENQPEFKIVQNGSWDIAWPENNWVITPDVFEGVEGVYNITISFNAETNEIGVTGEKTADINVYTATFTTDAAWNQVYAYAWTTTTETTGEGEEQVTNEVTTEFLGAWPGTLLTKNEATGAYEVAIKAVEAPAFIIFNDGAGQQTDNLPFEDGNAYNFVAGQDITVDVADGDIAAALTAAKDGIAKVGNITINLQKDVTYTVSASLEAPAGITINGNDAIIDASALEAPFIAMANVEEPTKWTEANVRIAGIKMTGLKQALFYSTCKNYIAKDFTVDWVNVEVAADVTLFDYTKGSTAQNFTVTNSTFYAPASTSKAFYSSQSGQKLTEYSEYTSDMKQTFTFTNNTIYNFAKTKNFFTHRQANQTWLTYDVQNNIFVDCGKSGQVIKGMNGGQSGKNPTWIIIGNVFNFDGADTSAAEATGDADHTGDEEPGLNETVQNSLAGVITFADAANGDFNGEFTLGEDATAPEAAIGAPAWTITYKEYVPEITSMAIVGDFIGGEATEEEAEPWWNPANGWAMTQDAENPAIWTLTKEFVAENKTYEYKAVANGQYGVYELPAEGNQNWVFAENSDYPAGNYTLVFIADTENHTLTLQPQGPDAPELTAPEGWTNAITNGNLAGETTDNFIVKDATQAQGTAVITPGAGKGGSRGILVKSPDETEKEGAAAWDTQFWIQLNEAVPAGTKLHVEFDYKASKAAKASTQAHYTPGAYQHWGMMGDVNFTTEWQHFSADIDVDDAMAGTKTENGETTVGPGLLSIAFNLQEEKSATDYQFDNFGVWYKKPAVIDDWTDIIVNGDMEGESTECFYVTEQGIGGPFLANITEGIGVDGSKAVKVESYNDPAQDWDSQFFIRLPYQIPAGTKYKVSFDYKADKAGGFDTQAHTEPGGYIHWACIGSGNFTTAWQTYEAEGTITADMSKEGQLMQTIAFNLAKNKVATCFVFDNVKFLVPTDVVPTLNLNPAQNPRPYTKPVYNSMAIVGDFLGLEATEEDANPNWNPANGWEMTQDAENDAVWTLVKDEFTAEAKTYEYKATANGNWDDYVLPADKNADYNFDTANLGAGKYKLTFTVDTRKHSVNLDVEKLDVTTYTATFTTDAEWEEVYAYAWSGEEPNVKKFLGDWPGTKLEAVDGVYTVNIMSTDAPEKIIFNNGNSGEGNQTRDLEFANGGAYEYKKPTGEEAPVKLAPEGWTLATTNGNLAGDDASSYVMKEYPSTDIVPAAIEAGAGTEGSRGIVVKAGDDTANDNYAAWDSQFWIQLAEAVPAGTKLHVEFDYKASQAAKATTQAHNTPGAYQHWGMIGDVNFTTEWQTFSADIEVNDAMAGNKVENGVVTEVGPGLLTIAFNLQEEKSATNYYFDNFGVWYQKPVTIESMAIVGDFLGLATEENPNANWDPANGWAMEQDAENPAVWTLTKDFTAEAKTYEYKATANGKWGDYELPAEGNKNFVFGTDEYPAGDYKLVFTADTENNTLDLVVKPSTIQTFTATFTTNAYWWDEVYAYAWTEEGENVTEYLGAWPGTKLKVNADGVYTVNVEGEVAPAMIVFNNGSTGEGNQTEDLEFVADKAYEYVFTPTFDFENNNGQWAENETFANGATMDDVTLTGVKNVKYTSGQLRIGNRTGNFKLTAPEGKKIEKIELKVLKAGDLNLTPSTGEVANTKTLTQGDEESSTVVYSIWTWTGAESEVSFDLSGAMQRNLGFINVTLGDGETTGINTMAIDTKDAMIYNLSGQKVQNPKKGLYIVNGKKIVLK